MVSGCEGHISGYEVTALSGCEGCHIGMRGTIIVGTRGTVYRDAKAQITGYEGRGIGTRGMRKSRRKRYLVARKALADLPSPP
jgi:hypothetical protein